jgi:hypothetical protein
VATNEWLTVITSSPGFTPAARRAMCSAAVPVFVATTWRSCRRRKAAISCSNFAVRAPMPSQPTWSASVTAFTVSMPVAG